MIEDEKLLKACNKVWDKISNIKQKRFDNEPVYNVYLKTKIKSYGDNINKNFKDNGMPKEDFHDFFG